VSDWYFENGGEWQEVVFDSQHFIISSVNQGVSDDRVVELMLSSNQEGFMLKYANLIPGEYFFNLFDVAGKLLQSQQVNIADHPGSLVIKSVYANKHEFFLYELKNNGGLNFKGKQAL
jgi:regulatory protein YycH of two-component signal transduction system YycFG